ncbi:hypothetical protein PENTCL1PPCAC_21376, partial [Pristionchus entomophagus]
MLHLINGGFAMGTWCGASAGCLLLVTNRLCELTGQKFFTPEKTNLFIFFVMCYALFMMLFSTPCLTDSKRLGMYFDPVISDQYRVRYANYFHNVNNILIVGITALLYILLCVVLVVKQ